MASTRSPALLIVSLLAVAACSSDSSVDATPYVDAVRADLETDESGFVLEGGSAECVASALVDAAGAERLDEAGVSPEDFASAESFDDVDVDLDPEQLRADLSESLGACALGAPLTDVFVSEFPYELSDEDTTCVVRSLDEGDELSAGLADSLVDGDDAGIQTSFSTALTDCPSVTGNLLAETISAAGVPVSDEARVCITDEMEARGRQGVDHLIEGGAPAQALGQEIGEACLEGLDG